MPLLMPAHTWHLVSEENGNPEAHRVRDLFAEGGGAPAAGPREAVEVEQHRLALL